MNKQQRRERINRRCEILEKLGFVVYHEDKHVVLVIGDNNIPFDFSAIDETKFITYAFKKILEYGENKGKIEIRQKLNDILGDKND